MKDIDSLLANNKQWARKMEMNNPGFFSKLKKQQPKFLWIGCSDSRVPANQITGLLPGDVFVHRNIANQVINTDINLMSVLQYAIDELKVKHIIICGHYGCGGIEAVWQNQLNGLLDHWLCNVKSIMHEKTIKAFDELCEANVIKQVHNLADNTIVRNAWRNKRRVHIHGWIYSISNGLIKDLNVTLKGIPSNGEKYNE